MPYQPRASQGIERGMAVLPAPGWNLDGRRRGAAGGAAAVRARAVMPVAHVGALQDVLRERRHGGGELGERVEPPRQFPFLGERGVVGNPGYGFSPFGVQPRKLILRHFGGRRFPEPAINRLQARTRNPSHAV